MLVWLNGTLQESAAARIAPLDRGFTLGDGVFETLRISANQPLYLEQHLARLGTGAALLQIAFDARLVQRAITELLAASRPGNAALRVTLSRGEGPRGLLPPAEATPTLLITTAPLVAPAKEVSVIVARSTRRNELSPLSRIKSLNMLDNLLARQEAQAAGVDDALLLNSRGCLTESSISNIIAQREGVLVTPPLADGVLPGITRARLMQLLPIKEVSMGEADLATLEAMVLTNSLGVRAVARLQGRALASLPLFQRCIKALAAEHPGESAPATSAETA